MEMVSVELSSIDLDQISISKPKKTEDSLFGNISCDAKQLNVRLYNTQVIQHKKVRHLSKSYTVLFLKVSKATCKHIVELDNHCIDHVKANFASWFAKSFDENIIEDYYTSSVLLSKTNGYVFKLKLQGDDDLLEPSKYDFVLGLKGLRFYKQRFIPEWEIVNIKPVENDFLNSIRSDSDDSWEEDMIETESVPEPDAEEVRSITNALRARIQGRLDALTSEQAAVANKIEECVELLSKLNASAVAIPELDKISEYVENLSCPR
jgi:protein-tyrosine phosphatase